MFGILNTTLLLIIIFFIGVFCRSCREVIPFLLESYGHPADGCCDIQIFDIEVFDQAADILILHITTLDTQARKALKYSFLNVIVGEYFVAIGALHWDKPIKEKTEIIIIKEQILDSQILQALEHTLCCLKSVESWSLAKDSLLIFIRCGLKCSA